MAQKVPNFTRKVLRVVCLLALACVHLMHPQGVAGFELTIIHTNDVRARFEPISASGGECTAELEAQGTCFGGLARRAAKIEDIREASENVLLLDAGHQFQGSMWFYVYRGLAAAHFMNRLSYDAMAIGQHEFDFGVAGLARFIQNLTFPVIASNIDTSREPNLDGLLSKHHVVRFANGQRVGIVGYSYAETPNIANTGNLAFIDEVEGLQPAVDSLISSGINQIVAVGHSGYDKALDIASRLVGVDVVVSGRDSTLLYTGEKPSTETPRGDFPTVVHPAHDPTATVLVVQAWQYGKYLGNLSVSFDDEGAVTGFGGNTILLDDSVEEDEDILEEMEPWRDHVTEVANQVVGQTTVDLDIAACTSAECALGNLVADAMLFPNLNTSDGWSDVGISITTTGSMASSADIGDITTASINKIIPYGDTIDVIELQGRYLLEALENSVYEWDEAKINYQMMQMAGMRVVYDVSRPPGQRVVSADVRCANCPVPVYQKLRPDAVYKVVVNSYIEQGKYGYSSFLDKTSVRRGGLDADILRDYLQTYSPISHSVEIGRQFIYNGDAPCYTDVKSSGNTVKARDRWLFVMTWFMSLRLIQYYG
ncbi:snake venom 5'-nucleotidase-like [Patiria miniata]|uniref:5'-nucleotidase n=1 Tax=Patiria miniata TaxID=46514 RepID=A0A914BNK4_PATMI|nr:snake venom 5'-nucleotidase-like [Patiria miniata]